MVFGELFFFSPFPTLLFLLFAYNLSLVQALTSLTRTENLLLLALLGALILIVRSTKMRSRPRVSGSLPRILRVS